VTDKIYRSTAKSEYKLSDAELDTLSCESVANPHYRSGPPSRMYLRADVEALAASDKVQARLAAKAERDEPEAKQARREAREAKITRRFCSWKDALLPACEAMFNLNRYAKHDSCRSREEIYDLKNQLVALLYQQGACIECLAHERHLPEKICRACDGTGVSERDPYLDEIEEDFGVELVGNTDEKCLRCRGTGIYLPAKTLRDIAFKFMVCGRMFAWHQPDDLIDFEYEISATEQGCPAEENPLEMSTAKMREGKVIIRYVLANAPQLAESVA
jgi:hypothetical protein